MVSPETREQREGGLFSWPPHIRGSARRWSWPEARSGAKVGTVIGLVITLITAPEYSFFKLPPRTLSELGINLGIIAGQTIFAAAVGARIKGVVESDQEAQE